MEGSYLKCDRGNGHFTQRDGCSFKYKGMKQLGQFREWQVNKVWLEQRIRRWEYQVSKGYIMMGLVCLTRRLELILKEIGIPWNICKQENCIVFMSKKIRLFWQQNEDNILVGACIWWGEGISGGHTG